MEGVVSEPKPVFLLQQAPSGRSTCKATGEKIPKDAWRVGMSVHFQDHETTAWQMVLPLLKSMRVEYCMRANSGTCKHSGHKFEKGEVRVVAPIGEKARSFITVPAAAELLPPLIEAAGGEDVWQPTDISGLEKLKAEDRESFYREFGVSKAYAAAFDKANPPPEAEEASAAKAPPKKRQKKGGAAAEGEETHETKKPAKGRGTKKGGAADIAEDEPPEETGKKAGNSSKKAAAKKAPAAKGRKRKTVKEAETEGEEAADSE